jgi:hypothetical protein
MGWHPKAQLIDALNREARAAEARRRRAQGGGKDDYHRTLTIEELQATHDAAEAHLQAHGGPDPEGPARLAQLWREVQAARKHP